MTSAPDNSKNQNEVNEAQLRKLQLEIQALEREGHFDDETAAQKHQKLNLELQSLAWQNGLIYRLGQFATIFTILATLVTVFATGFGIWTAYTKLVSDREKEAELKDKEFIERTNTQYRTELNQLLQYPVKEEQTIAEAVFLFRDIGSVIEEGYKDEMLGRKREEVGFLFSQLIRSPEFDLSKTRNISFDIKALNYLKYYKEYLVDKPYDNRDILSKYKNELEVLSSKDQKYYENLVVDSNDASVFIEDSAYKDQTKFFQYVFIFQAYKNHVNLFDESLKKDKISTTQAVDFKRLAFCWFYGATKNKSLTINIFGGDETKVESLWQGNCHQ